MVIEYQDMYRYVTECDTSSEHFEQKSPKIAVVTGGYQVYCFYLSSLPGVFHCKNSFKLQMFTFEV